MYIQKNILSKTEILGKIEAQKEKIAQIELNLTQEEYYLRGIETVLTMIPENEKRTP